MKQLELVREYPSFGIYTLLVVSRAIELFLYRPRGGSDIHRSVPSRQTWPCGYCRRRKRGRLCLPPTCEPLSTCPPFFFFFAFFVVLEQDRVLFVSRIFFVPSCVLPRFSSCLCGRFGACTEPCATTTSRSCRFRSPKTRARSTHTDRYVEMHTAAALASGPSHALLTPCVRKLDMASQLNSCTRRARLS